MICGREVLEGMILNHVSSFIHLQKALKLVALVCRDHERAKFELECPPWKSSSQKIYSDS